MWSLMSDHEGRLLLGVHAKRTYALQRDGRCSRDTPQAPLLVRPIINPDGDEVFTETDVVPSKAGVDVVVMGSAHGRGRRQSEMSIRLAGRTIRYAVFGPRRCSYTGPGTLRFSEPEPFDSIPARYDRAYGGVDPTVPDQKPVENLIDLLDHHPGLYPRNPIGKGYAVFENRARLDGLELPNFEHPGHLLRPDTLVVRRPAEWWRQPFPWCCEWFDKTWYPRCAYMGHLPEVLPPNEHEMYEITHHLLEAPQRQKYPDALDTFDVRFYNAASPALVFPSLRGDEAVEVTGMTPEGRFVVQLPGDAPEFAVRVHGRAQLLEPKLERVLISVEEWGVSLVWHATLPAPRDILHRAPGPGDDITTLVRAEAFVDRKPVEMIR